MKFGPVATAGAEGAILAHGLTAGAAKFRKGRKLSAEDIAALTEAGVAEVVVAALSEADMSEDEAADRIGRRLAALGLTASAPFTGRSNLHAEAAGVLQIDAEAIARINRIHEAITLATLAPNTRVRARQMVATVKIIPYAAPASAVRDAVAALDAAPLTLHPFALRSANLILTETPGLKPSLLTKAETSVRDRLTSLGLSLHDTQTVPHTAPAVAEALITMPPADITLIFGASATSDRADACPAGLVAAGGQLTRFGMPVDPGNLLFLGERGGLPVIGLPGCARSPALNGADQILERIVARMPVSSDDISAMGVGGLLKEIPTRPRPRAAAPSESDRPHVEVLLLAAGASRRMGPRDKLLETIDGTPLLARSAAAMAASQADGVTVVLPPNAPKRTEAIRSLNLKTTIATDAAAGMAASLRAGLAALPKSTDAVIVALADMPDITAAHVDRLIAAYDPSENREIVRALDETGRPGHPVLFARRFFESLANLTGDAGAKTLIRDAEEFVVDVPTPGLGASTDLDTPEAWDAWRAVRSKPA